MYDCDDSNFSIFDDNGETERLIDEIMQDVEDTDTESQAPPPQDSKEQEQKQEQKPEPEQKPEQKQEQKQEAVKSAAVKAKRREDSQLTIDDFDKAQADIDEITKELELYEASLKYGPPCFCSSRSSGKKPVEPPVFNCAKLQIYNKYSRPSKRRRRRRFSEEEDVLLLKYYDAFGVDFKKIAMHIPHRSAVQVKIRFNILTQLSAIWSEQSDRKLIKIMSKWDANIDFSKAIIRHFPGKDRANIRSRYIKLIKLFRIHPAAFLSKKAPRPHRGVCRLLYTHKTVCLNDPFVNLNI